MTYVAVLFLFSLVHVQHAKKVDDTCEGMGFLCITFYECPVNKTLGYKGCTGWKSCCSYPEYSWCKYRGGTCKGKCGESDIVHPYGRCSSENDKCCLTPGKGYSHW
uniref:Carboxypeptidase inhibitor n=1 Tax=Rhipicephalus zambeziensis TaxID=60191 RepID=A0A224Y521_9ACAR